MSRKPEEVLKAIKDAERLVLDLEVEYKKAVEEEENSMPRLKAKVCDISDIYGAFKVDQPDWLSMWYDYEYRNNAKKIDYYHSQIKNTLMNLNASYSEYVGAEW